ncbi:MAG: hypothetical protein LUG86_07095 [Oscillospiraceae bacterium]|nr:hypothetical protein [Oscillospiraceae bacterium]
MSRRKLPPEVLEEHLRRQKKIDRKRYYGKTANLYPRHAWTKEEEKLVMEHSMPDSELSLKIGRSLKSIQEKRRRLKSNETESTDE